MSLYVSRIADWAIKCHRDTNHRYGAEPYEYHLKQVVAIAKNYRDQVRFCTDDEWDNILAACWCHDLIEDCRISYNDLVEVVNKEVAEIVYAVTTEKGRTRKDRANANYYIGIRDNRFAKFVKLCDRIANVTEAEVTNHGMFLKYKEEHPNFISKLWVQGQYDDMWMYLNSRFSEVHKVEKLG